MSTTHDAITESTIDVIRRFNDATNAHDVEAMMTLMTDDVVFENTMPPPDGERVEGQAAMRAVWEGLFRASPNARFDEEELIAWGDRCVVRWRYTFDSTDPSAGHIRGIDLFRVRDGAIAEKLSYVKG